MTKVTRQAQLQQIQSGLNKHFSSATQFTLGGATYSLSDLQGLIQEILAALSAVAQAKAALATQVQVEDNAIAKAAPVLRLLKNFVISQLGDTKEASSALADFGYTPRLTTKSSVKVKAEAVDKSLNTRVEDHDLGKKEKEKLKATQTSPAAAPAPSATAATAPKA
jgi:hypothetical protein